jgi:hypothetical protein
VGVADYDPALEQKSWSEGKARRLNENRFRHGTRHGRDAAAHPARGWRAGSARARLPCTRLFLGLMPRRWRRRARRPNAPRDGAPPPDGLADLSAYDEFAEQLAAAVSGSRMRQAWSPRRRCMLWGFESERLRWKRSAGEMVAQPLAKRLPSLAHGAGQELRLARYGPSSSATTFSSAGHGGCS